MTVLTPSVKSTLMETVMKKTLIRLVIVVLCSIGAGCGGANNGPAIPPDNPVLENTSKDGSGPPDLRILQERAKK